MILKPAELPTHLTQSLKSVYLIHGDEPLLLQEAADQIRIAARQQGVTERSVFTVTGAQFNWSAVLQAGGSQSLFAERQMLEIRIPSGKLGKHGDQALQELLQKTHGDDAMLLLLLMPRLDKAAQASPWLTALAKRGALIPVDSVERKALPAWIAQRLDAQGQRVEDGEPGQHSLQFFADRVEGNLLAAHQEIQKLGLLYAPGVLDFEQIEVCVLNVARYDVFKLGDAVLAGQLARVQRMLDGLQAEGEIEVRVHYTLSEDIRALHQVKISMRQGQAMPVALRQTRVWGQRERRFERVLPGLKMAELDQLLLSAHKVDGLVKGLRQPDWPTNPWHALHRLAFQLCRACQLAVNT